MFSLKTIRLHNSDIIATISFSSLSTLETVFKSHQFLSFSCICKVKTLRKVCGFDENDIKTYSCRQGVNRPITVVLFHFDLFFHFCFQLDDGAVRVWRNYVGIEEDKLELVTAWQALSGMIPSTRGKSLFQPQIIHAVM